MIKRGNGLFEAANQIWIFKLLRLVGILSFLDLHSKRLLVVLELLRLKNQMIDLTLKVSILLLQLLYLLFVRRKLLMSWQRRFHLEGRIVAAALLLRPLLALALGYVGFRRGFGHLFEALWIPCHTFILIPRPLPWCLMLLRFTLNSELDVLLVSDLLIKLLNLYHC